MRFSELRASGGGPPESVTVEIEEPFRLLVESIRDYAIFILDTTGHILTWNAGAQRIKGYTTAEIVGRHFSTFYPSEVAASSKCQEELEIATRDGRFEEEGWRVRKNGSLFWASVIITALRDRSGALVGFAKVTRDLTERRAAEEETRRFRLLVESVKDYAIFILDPDGRVATWNPGAERIKGYTAEEIIGQHFSIFYSDEDARSGRCDGELETAVREGRFEEEGFRYRKDRTRFWANVTITALRDPAGKLVGFAKVTRDLTERRQAEQTARDLAVERAALAEKASTQEFQERFLAILGHDLRNPLASIDMGASLLRQRTIDPATIRVLARMRSSAQRMTRMIEQILDLTRSRLATGVEIYVDAMDLRDALAAIVGELLIAQPGREILLVAPPLPGRWDRDRLEQVFSNLIGNALAYGDPAQPVTVSGSVSVGEVRVEVHNGGEPIPEDLQKSLFDPFRRGVRESRTAKTSGLGLGLYISSEIIRAHGGTIALRSDASSGTTFEITLPCSQESG